MITREDYLKALDIVEAYHKQLNIAVEKNNPGSIVYTYDRDKTIDDLSYDGYMSTRLFHNLRAYMHSELNIDSDNRTIGSLSNISVSYFRSRYPVGKKLITELHEICSIAGVVMKP